MSIFKKSCLIFCFCFFLLSYQYETQLTNKIILETPALTSDANLLYGYSNRENALKILERIPEDQLAPLTYQAQKLLYDWQHPFSCKSRKFVVSDGSIGNGLGSNVHVSSAHMAFAMHFDAIFLWSRNAGEKYTDIQTCLGLTNFECFVDPPSNCTLEDTFAIDAEVILEKEESLPSSYRIFVPKIFIDLWENSGLPTVIGENTGESDVIKYWFRTQVAAYLLRFNTRSLTFMANMRSNTALLKEVRGPFSRINNLHSFNNRPHLLPKTLPSGTISIHIRHGDKGQEMSLVPTETYFMEATRLVKLHPLSLANYQIFLSTEDPDAILEFVNKINNGTDRQKTFSLFYWDVPRENSNGIQQLEKFSSIPRGELTLIWFLQLLLALECDLWIGTRGSNWNRLIDELRCVWVAKCQHMYSEVGDEHNWETLSW